MDGNTLVFDVGKTHKKVFVFDTDYRVLYQDSIMLPEVQDEEGDACDDLETIVAWMKGRFQELLETSEYNIQKVNFTSYGASWVHIDEYGVALTALYNYLKPFPDTLKEQLCQDHDWARIACETGSPYAGMLNSALQLYWLKKEHSEQFSAVFQSLHLPQYLSLAITGEAYTEYTSIGCHTALWDFEKRQYHRWVRAEELDVKQAPIRESEHAIEKECFGKSVQLGIGIHDSSAALLPYLKGSRQPFVLLSTGTWSVALNPFVPFETQTKEETLYYLQTDGSPVRASRLFLGHEHEHQVKQLSALFEVAPSYFYNLPFQKGQYLQLKKRGEAYFKWQSLENASIEQLKDPRTLPDPATAYYQLVYELVQLQKGALQRALGSSSIAKVFVDGGFTGNDVFIKTLAYEMPELRFFSSENAVGTALGAAMVLSSVPLAESTFEWICQIREVVISD